MDVSNVKVSQSNSYSKVETTAGKAKTEGSEVKAASAETEAATFAADGGRQTTGSVDATAYKMDMETIDQLRQENEQRMVNLVKQMLGQQVEKADLASAITKDNVLEAIKAGKFSQEDIEQAQKDTADDGYWGVEQTSDRFVKYATALTGGDPDKLDSMIEAFEKGYAEAEKQWGGKLPDLAQRTREATLKKFQDLKDQYSGGATGAAAAQSVLENKVQTAMNDAE